MFFLSDRTRFWLVFFCFFFCSHIAFAQIQVLNATGDTCTLNDNGRYLILLIDENACHVCVERLSQLINSAPVDTIKTKLIVLTKRQDDPFKRRIHLLELKESFPLAGVYYDIPVANKSLYFKYDMQATPAILLIKNTSCQLLEHKDIFNSMGININARQTLHGFLAGQ